MIESSFGQDGTETTEESLSSRIGRVAGQIISIFGKKEDPIMISSSRLIPSTSSGQYLTLGILVLGGLGLLWYVTRQTKKEAKK